MAAGGPGADKTNNGGGMHAGQPGSAWAARRELWRHGGLYALPLMGGGDTAFIYTLFNQLTDEKILQSMGLKEGVNFKPFKKWRKMIYPYVNENVGFVPGTIIHEWHGDMVKRNYATRYELMEQIDFYKSVRLDRNGLVKIINVDDSFYKKMKKYFQDRLEDGDNAVIAKKKIYKDIIKYCKDREANT